MFKHKSLKFDVAVYSPEFCKKYMCVMGEKHVLVEIEAKFTVCKSHGYYMKVPTFMSLLKNYSIVKIKINGSESNVLLCCVVCCNKHLKYMCR